MTIPTLPTELLNEICSLVSSHSDLYHALLCSKRLADIVKPFLYHHITIETKQQRERLKRVRQEDKRLVKKLVITGTLGYLRSTLSYREVVGQECGVGVGCVKDLLVGDLLDFSSIEVLHIKNVNENGARFNEELAKFHGAATGIAANLVELSVSNHRDAGHIWNYVLRSPVVPKLRLLGFCGNGVLKRDYMGDEGERTYVDDFALPSTTPLSQLDLLVTTSVGFYDNLSELPRSKTLVIVNLPAYVNRSFIQGAIASYPHVRFPWNSDHPLNEANYRSSLSDNLRFLSLPYIDADLINKEGSEWLTQIKGKGVEVHFDAREGDSSTSLIPQHFVDYLKKVERMKR